MGRKGATSGLKRKPAPRSWPISRKQFTWVVRPSAGPHSLDNSLPLAVVLRDVLGFAGTRKEAKTIVSSGRIWVDGRIVREDDFPVGLMDVISIPDADKAYRVLPSKKGLVLNPINGDELKFKLCRIEDKAVSLKGNVQLNLHDGSNLLLKVADPKNPTEDVYETLDTIKISLPDRQPIERIKMNKDDHTVITGGKNVGRFGRIVEIEKAEAKKRRNALVTVEDEKGNRYQTILDFVFATGEKQSAISLPEVSQVV